MSSESPNNVQGYGAALCLGPLGIAQPKVTLKNLGALREILGVVR